MVSQITEGVKVSVETIYQAEYSNPAHNNYMFAYKINIENLSDCSIQLISRHWHIFDSMGAHREVGGEGVVGQQPVIAPGNSHEYTSGCHLKTDMGSMQGTYLMRRMVDKEEFQVNIPEIYLIAPYRLN